jgi:hypothetical protein
MKKTLTRLAAALTALAFAAPALPCGLMQQSAADKAPTPAVAQAPRADPKAQPQPKVARKANVAKKTAVAAN